MKKTIKRIFCLFIAAVFTFGVFPEIVKAEDENNLIDVANPASANRDVWSYSDGIWTMTNSNYTNLRYDVELEKGIKIIFSFDAEIISGKVNATIRTLNNEFLVSENYTESSKITLNYTVLESGIYRFQICGTNEVSCAKISNISVTVDDGKIELPKEYSEESKALTEEIKNVDSDLNILLFSDNHSYSEYKYLKYPDIMSHGLIDYQIGLGDYVDYSHISKNVAKSRLESSIELSGKETNCFYVYGNHDVGICGVNAGSDSLDVVMTPDENYELYGKHLESNDAVKTDDENPHGGYYYVDDENSKIRMIILNTSDIFNTDFEEVSYIRYQQQLRVSQKQLSWFANTALDFSKKINPSEWAVIVFGHSYAPNGDTLLFEILDAVQKGESINKTVVSYRRLLQVEDGNYINTVDTGNGDTYSVNADYSNQGPVSVIGFIHGHDHVDNNSVISGINRIQIRCDNGDLDNYYIAPWTKDISNETYYFYTADKKIFSFKRESCTPITDIGYIGYNYYWFSAGGTWPIALFDKNFLRLRNISGVTEVDSVPENGIEITGFVPERGESLADKESCVVISIDRNSEKLIFTPYGTGTKRNISYVEVNKSDKKYKLADLNLDGSVDVFDAYTARLIAAKLLEPTKQQIALGDVDVDGKITAIDANIIRKYSVGIIDSLPIQ